jgi:hypothetical protein
MVCGIRIRLAEHIETRLPSPVHTRFRMKTLQLFDLSFVPLVRSGNFIFASGHIARRDSELDGHSKVALASLPARVCFARKGRN